MTRGRELEMGLGGGEGGKLAPLCRCTTYMAQKGNCLVRVANNSHPPKTVVQREKIDKERK